MAMIKARWRLFRSSALLLIALGGCSPAEPVFHATDKPARLSDWNLLRIQGGELQANPASLVFQPANRLFSDYAQKLRSLWIPEGSKIGFMDGRLEYPVGTILTKTFYYPLSGDQVAAAPPADDQRIALNKHRVLETRLLVRRTTGWQAFPYIWNSDQSEAFLRVAGGNHELTMAPTSGTADSVEFTYFVPNENQCAGCHVTRHPDGELEPLGAVASQLQAYLPALQTRGWIDELPEQTAAAEQVTSWLDDQAPVTDRAIAYLDMNCGHCHNPDGAADTSALILDGSHTSMTRMGLCKPPVAAGGGAGNLRFSIVPGAPEQSILLYRMQSNKADEMMPELGRSLVHQEGVELVREWIAGIPGNCN